MLITFFFSCEAPSVVDTVQKFVPRNAHKACFLETTPSINKQTTVYKPPRQCEPLLSREERAVLRANKAKTDCLTTPAIDFNVIREKTIENCLCHAQSLYKRDEIDTFEAALKDLFSDSFDFNQRLNLDGNFLAELVKQNIDQDYLDSLFKSEMPSIQKRLKHASIVVTNKAILNFDSIEKWAIMVVQLLESSPGIESWIDDFVNSLRHGFSENDAMRKNPDSDMRIKSFVCDAYQAVFITTMLNNLPSGYIQKIRPVDWQFIGRLYNYLARSYNHAFPGNYLRTRDAVDGYDYFAPSNRDIFGFSNDRLFYLPTCCFLQLAIRKVYYNLYGKYLSCNRKENEMVKEGFLHPKALPDSFNPLFDLSKIRINHESLCEIFVSKLGKKCAKKIPQLIKTLWEDMMEIEHDEYEKTFKEILDILDSNILPNRKQKVLKIGTIAANLSSREGLTPDEVSYFV